MNLYGYLVIGCNEVANIDRAAAYVSEGLLGATYNFNGCETCDHLILEPGEEYAIPGQGDTPWSDSSIWASDEFLGILPQRMDLQTVLGRSVRSKANGGGFLSPFRTRPRVLNFSGLMMATSERGMAYGDRWLNEVLAGSRCGDCPGDEATIVPSCPEDGYDPPEFAFRRLVGVGVTDGPILSPFQNFPEAKLQQVTFQLTAEESYLYGWPETIASDIVIGDYFDAECVGITAPTWNDTTAVVTLTAETAAENIHVYAKRSPNNQPCPFEEGEECWEATIPSLPAGGRITFDGVRRQVRYYDPSLKDERSGLSLLELDGPVTYPVAAPCSTICICAEATSGTVVMSVDKVDREL